MSELLLLIIFLIIGGLTGILVGMLGIGGGVVFVPVLYFFLPLTGIDNTQIAYIAVGTSLFAGSIASFSSGTNHLLADNVHKTNALFLGLGSIISSFVAPYFVVEVPSFYLKLIIAIILLAVALKMIFGKDYDEHGNDKKNNSKPSLFFFGLMVGALAAFAGIGGGVLFVPILAYYAGMGIKKSVGTSSTVTFLTMFSSAVSYALKSPAGNAVQFQLGYIYLVAGIPLGLGSATGAYFGVKFALRKSGTLIKKIFSLLLIIAVIKILFEF